MAVLDKCIELVTQVSGRRPTGYVAPWWEFSTVTNELLLERHSSARGDRRQPHGSFLTRRWREMDSNHRSSVRWTAF
jgi:peptidoglycan/xylan/chitin deacetylase (PgdA/CDA1 family)